jgi:hypothetical protein
MEDEQRDDGEEVEIPTYISLPSMMEKRVETTTDCTSRSLRLDPCATIIPARQEMEGSRPRSALRVESLFSLLFQHPRDEEYYGSGGDG